MLNTSLIELLGDVAFVADNRLKIDIGLSNQAPIVNLKLNLSSIRTLKINKSNNINNKNNNEKKKQTFRRAVAFWQLGWNTNNLE